MWYLAHSFWKVILESQATRHCYRHMVALTRTTIMIYGSSRWGGGGVGVGWGGGGGGGGGVGGLVLCYTTSYCLTHHSHRPPGTVIGIWWHWRELPLWFMVVLGGGGGGWGGGGVGWGGGGGGLVLCYTTSYCLTHHSRNEITEIFGRRFQIKCLAFQFDLNFWGAQLSINQHRFR